jgi:hypothetical protein
MQEVDSVDVLPDEVMWGAKEEERQAAEAKAAQERQDVASRAANEGRKAKKK